MPRASTSMINVDIRDPKPDRGADLADDAPSGPEAAALARR